MRKLALAIAFSLALCPAALAEKGNLTVHGVPAPGPAIYDHVYVHAVGPLRAERVLVLVPGYFGGAGSMTPVAREIVKRVPDMQVWMVDRRENAFEDTYVFEGGDPAEAQRYYLERFEYERVRGEDVPFVGKWGLRVALGDLRRVIRKARAGGRREVILGGHSLGASTAVAYASWDFHGRPGYRDIDGLVLIDGGLLGTFDSADVDRARRLLAEIRSGQVFDDLLGLGLPEIAGIFVQTAALWAWKQPDDLSAIQQHPLVPPEFKPPVPATNAAALGFAFDADTSPPGFELMRVRAGRLADSGNPRPWHDGENTPVERLARAFASVRPNGMQWYFSKRLRLDVDAMSPLHPTAATRLLGLRPFHADEIDVPLYAYGTDLTGGRVERGARSLVRMSDIPRSRVIADPKASHVDPLVAAPARNRFLHTVVPFLRRIRSR